MPTPIDKIEANHIRAAAAFLDMHPHGYSKSHSVVVEGRRYPVRVLFRRAWIEAALTERFKGSEERYRSWIGHLIQLGFQVDDNVGISYVTVPSTAPVLAEPPEPTPEDALAATNADLADLNDPTMDATTCRRLVDARLGQGKFRRDLEERWDSVCAVTGISTRAVLRASHILPWRESSNEERLDPNNGLLLCANLDALFDRGLISFANDGTLLVSSRVLAETHALGLVDGTQLMKLPTAGQRRYLATHRSKHGFGDHVQ